MKMRKLASGILILCMFFGLIPVATFAASQLPNFSELVKKNHAVVVNISTTQTAKVSKNQLPEIPFPNLPKNSPFNEFFKHFFGEQHGGPGLETLRSLGSGFIISSDGYILTNEHVVDNADKIVVQLSDQREKPAKLIGSDKRTDVALLKIDAKNLPVAKLGDSKNLEVGQWVLAIGSPFGFDNSATQGIISALHRSLPSDTYVPFIQTDAPVNPGNSGGPLFNTNGEVIGINSQIYSNTGGYMGLSFAIPIDLAMQVSEQLKTKGFVTRGWLGVYIQPVDEKLAEALNLKRPEGALVTDVTKDSPASKGGIKTGDVIISFAGQKVNRSNDLPPMVAAIPAGKKVDVTVVRNGDDKTLAVTIGQLNEAKLAKSSSSSSSTQEIPRLKIVVANLTAEQRKKLNVGDRGVEVKQVDEGPAADAGVEAGDVILMVDHHDVDNSTQLANLIRKIPKDKPEPLLVQRGNNPIFLAIEIHG